jgi:hypothetical protein
MEKLYYYDTCGNSQEKPDLNTIVVSERALSPKDPDGLFLTDMFELDGIRHFSYKTFPLPETEHDGWLKKTFGMTLEEIIQDEDEKIGIATFEDGKKLWFDRTFLTSEGEKSAKALILATAAILVIVVLWILFINC